MSYSVATVAKNVHGKILKKANKSTLIDNSPKKKALKKSPSTKKHMSKEKVCIKGNVNYVLH